MPLKNLQNLALMVQLAGTVLTLISTVLKLLGEQ